jgi:hypothetical protein
MAFCLEGLFFVDAGGATHGEQQFVTANDPPLPIPPTLCSHRTEPNPTAIAANMIRLGKPGRKLP